MNMKVTMRAVAVCVLFGMMVMAASGGEKRVLIVNGAGVDKAVLEAVREHAERELFVPVATETTAEVKRGDLRSIGHTLAGKQTTNDVCVVALANGTADLHAVILTNEMVAVVNVAALKSEDTERFTRRLKRWVLRGVAILFEIGPDIDPHSVMCDYVTLEDLDMLGLNFSPPWMDLVRGAAEKRGLKVRAFGE